MFLFIVIKLNTVQSYSATEDAGEFKPLKNSLVADQDNNILFC